MSMLEVIKNDSIIARKARDTNKASLLATLFSEASMIGKNDGNRETTDAEVVKVVKKFIKGIDEMISVVGTKSRFPLEKEILSKYIPKQMDKEEMYDVVSNVLFIHKIERIPKNMGKVMALLKATYDGQYDGKVASQIVREKLL